MPQRHENELELGAATQRARKDRKAIERLLGRNPEVRDRIESVITNPSVVCHVFDRSVAFRVGKRSIKSIEGWPLGYKHAMNERAHVLFSRKPERQERIARQFEIELAARLMMTRRPEDVRTVSDPSDRAESEELDRLRELIDGRRIKVRLGDQVRLVDDARAIPGTEKADMVLTYRGDGVFRISHKMGRFAGDFRQYGGFVNDLGLRLPDDFDRLKGNDEVLRFRQDVARAMLKLGLRPDHDRLFDFAELAPGVCFAAPMSVRRAMPVIFGRDDSVDVVIDGSIELVPETGGVRNLRGSWHTAIHPRNNRGRLPDLSGVHEPTMLVMRSVTKPLTQAGFAHCRACVWPRNGWATSGIRKLREVLLASGRELKQLRNKMVH